MTRLPTPGQDSGQWGSILNDFLSQTHTSTGTLRPGVVSSTNIQDNTITTENIKDGAITTDKIANNTITSTKLDNSTQAAITAATTAIQPGDSPTTIGAAPAITDHNASTTPAAKALTVDNNGTLRVGDGTTQGGLVAGAAAFVAGRPTVVWVSASGGDDSHTGLVPAQPKATLAAALAALPADGGTVCVMSGTHTLTSGITVDVTTQSIIGEPRAVIDCSGMTTGTAVNFVGSEYPPYRQSRLAMAGLEFVGPGETSDLIAHTWDQPTGSAGPSRAEVSHVTIHHFGTGVKFGAHAYCECYRSCDIHDCEIGVDSEGGSDAGERLTFLNTLIYNSPLGIKQYSPTGEMVLVACSLDYNQTHADVSDAKLFLLGCHIEASTNKTQPDFVVGGNSGTLVVDGGNTCHSPTGTTAQEYFIVNNAGAGGGVFFENVHIGNIFPASGYLASGTGRTVFARTTTSPVSLMARRINTTDNRCVDGGFEHTTFPADDIFISADTAAITSRVTGANIQLSQSTSQAYAGTKSLKMHKTNGSGSVASFQIAVPITQRSKAYGTIRVCKPGTETGTIYVGWYYTAHLSNASGVPTNVKSQLLGTNTVTFTTNAYPWTLVTANGEATAPPWATHISCIVNAVSLVGPADVYFDEVEVYEM